MLSEVRKLEARSHAAEEPNVKDGKKKLRRERVGGHFHVMFKALCSIASTVIKQTIPSKQSCTKFLQALGASFDHNSMSISPAVVFNKTCKKIIHHYITISFSLTVS